MSVWKVYLWGALQALDHFYLKWIYFNSKKKRKNIHLLVQIKYYKSSSSFNITPFKILNNVFLIYYEI